LFSGVYLLVLIGVVHFAFNLSFLLIQNLLIFGYKEQFT
jgi:hypothetical protein